MGRMEIGVGTARERFFASSGPRMDARDRLRSGNLTFLRCPRCGHGRCRAHSVPDAAGHNRAPDRPGRRWFSVSGSPLLTVRGISKRFGAVQALSDVDLEIGKGETVGLV